MFNEKINGILDLNTNFYKAIQKEFTKTRQNIMHGWFPLVELTKRRFKAKQDINVLDLGCGNGRFFVVLGKNIGSKINYLGVDNNDYFLTEGMLKYDYADFRKMDIFTELDKLDKKFDLVVGFGITHHIPTKEFRLNWFKQIAGLVNSGGLLAYSFWNLHHDNRITKAEEATDLEENDYYYGWGETDVKRYFHAYTDEEITEIIKLYEDLGFNLEQKYVDDGKSKKLNNYIVFSKT